MINFIQVSFRVRVRDRVNKILKSFPYYYYEGNPYAAINKNGTFYILKVKKNTFFNIIILLSLFFFSGYSSI